MRLGTLLRFLIITELQLPVSGEKVLDIGCYDGYLLSKFNAKRKVGIDTSPIPKYSDIEYIQGDFLDYNFGEEQFDKILAMDVLEHIENDELFLKKLVNLLSENSAAILSVPSKDIKIFPAFLQNWVDKKWGHFYRRGYTQLEIKYLFDNIECDLDIEFQTWSGPIFRFLYLPLNILWRISPNLVSPVLERIVHLDYKYKAGYSGYLYLIVYKRDNNNTEGSSRGRDYYSSQQLLRSSKSQSNH